MIFLLELLPQIWPWVFLMTGLLVLFLGARGLGLALLVVWLLFALALGYVSGLAAAFLGAAVGLAMVAPRMHGARALVVHGALILICIALAAHLISGFANLRILDDVQSGPRSMGYTLFLNFDKPMVLMLLCLAWPRLNAVEARIRTWPALSVAVVSLSLLPLAVAQGSLRFELSWPAWALLFFVANLLQTCLVEEAFFRGYVQRALNDRVGPLMAVLFTSVLFGLTHLGDGISLAIYAGLLGLGCGFVFALTGRLWAAVALHFVFNAGHLVFFTYPAAL
ncbi:MAG: lysostaphin resistance A-like protein [Paracoccaceae bacterium]